MQDLGSLPGSGRSAGEGNGNPLHYSCLENPTDRGAWQATVHGFTKSWTQLSDFTFRKILTFGLRVVLIIYQNKVFANNILYDSDSHLFLCKRSNLVPLSSKFLFSLVVLRFDWVWPGVHISGLNAAAATGRSERARHLRRHVHRTGSWFENSAKAITQNAHPVVAPPGGLGFLYYSNCILRGSFQDWAFQET